MDQAQIAQQVVTKFDWSIFWTVAGFAVTVIVSLYTFIRNFKTDIKNDIEKLDNRIFQLAMGKSLKEIMLEEKEKDE